MATLAANGFPNLANWAKAQKPGGGVIDMAITVSQKVPILDDVPWVEGNLPDGHKIAQVTGLPSGTWRTFNRGIDPTVVDNEVFEETCGMLEDASKVDVDLAKLNGDAAAYRAKRDNVKKIALGQQVATSIFYESASTNPERVHGLAARYGATNGIVNSSYVLKGMNGSFANGGVNCRSVWLICWSPDHVFGFYPKGSMAGLLVEDKGEQKARDVNSRDFWVYETKFQWKLGIGVEDYRYAVRLQWDPDDPDFDLNSKGMYLGMMNMVTQLFEKLPSARFYMDRTSKLLLNQQLAANDANYLTQSVLRGDEMVDHFQGIPIRTSDSLVQETAIS